VRPEIMAVSLESFDETDVADGAIKVSGEKETRRNIPFFQNTGYGLAAVGEFMSGEDKGRV
jgi:hypothetical protein